jgi:hypothetical protein
MIVLQQASWLCSLLFSIEMVELCFSAHFALHRDLTLYVCDKTVQMANYQPGHGSWLGSWSNTCIVSFR